MAKRRRRGFSRRSPQKPDTQNPTPDRVDHSLLSPSPTATLTEEESLQLGGDDGGVPKIYWDTVFMNSELLKKVIEGSLQFARGLEAQVNASKERIIALETALDESNNTAERLIAERDSSKDALKLARSEIEILRKSVAPASGLPNYGANADVDTRDYEDMRTIHGHIVDLYSICVEENAQLRMKLHTQEIEMESFRTQKSLEKKKLTEENIELKTMLSEMEAKLNITSKQLEESKDDLQDMESLNRVLVLKECVRNEELQEARRELISGLQVSHESGIGIKRMGEINQEPFRCVCMQKFQGEDWELKCAELCSSWQEKVKNPQWFPFKTTKKIDGTFDEEIDHNDEELKMLKAEWGSGVYEAVCMALSEINEYNPSTRYSVPEIWNFKEGRKARLREVIQYLLMELSGRMTSA